jgi:hypothetical protein
VDYFCSNRFLTAMMNSEAIDLKFTNNTWNIFYPLKKPYISMLSFCPKRKVLYSFPFQ